MVHNFWFPMDRTNGQRLFKRGVGISVAAQFEPMFVFGPLAIYPANAVRIPFNPGLNLLFHAGRKFLCVPGPSAATTDVVSGRILQRIYPHHK